MRLVCDVWCAGDVFGVLVTYFGETSSTVLFLKNGYPVATRLVLTFFISWANLLEVDHTYAECNWINPIWIKKNEEK
jgi:hypothetical protein